MFARRPRLPLIQPAATSHRSADTISSLSKSRPFRECSVLLVDAVPERLGNAVCGEVDRDLPVSCDWGTSARALERHRPRQYAVDPTDDERALRRHQSPRLVFEGRDAAYKKRLRKMVTAKLARI